MASHWLLDTSALLALRDNEAGAERVADLLRQAIDGQGMVLACFMSRLEVI
jgi:PIN domain nuclease of toxin-antitoxin system